MLAELERRAAGTAVALERVPAAARLRRVADGALDAALLPGASSHPGVRLELVWTDAIVVALPSTHPIAAAQPLELAQLAALPVRLPEREHNPPLVDAVVAACRAAGFELQLAPAMTDQDMLAAIAAGEPTWTVYYAAQADVLDGTPGVVFRSLADVPLEMPTQLAVRADRVDPRLEALLAACRAVS